MNTLTAQLNAKVQNIITNFNDIPAGASLTFVDTKPFFEDHRFCEDGVSEPSYRNPNIWFYPFEYWTGVNLDFDGNSVPNGDCETIFSNSTDQVSTMHASWPMPFLREQPSISMTNRITFRAMAT
jgi:hypothetical protein